MHGKRHDKPQKCPSMKAWPLTLGAVVVLVVNGTAAFEKPRQPTRIHADTVVVLQVRGGDRRGSSIIEENPNYVGTSRPVQLGEIDEYGHQQSSGEQPYFGSTTTTGTSTTPATFDASNLKLQEIPQRFRRLSQQLHQNHPAISISLWLSLAIFLAWQLPAARSLLGTHFVCSRRNLHGPTRRSGCRLRSRKLTRHQRLR